MCDTTVCLSRWTTRIHTGNRLSLLESNKAAEEIQNALLAEMFQFQYPSLCYVEPSLLGCQNPLFTSEIASGGF